MYHPPSPPDQQHCPDLQHDAIEHTSLNSELVSSKAPDTNPNEQRESVTDESELPLSWDSIIDGSLPSQPHNRYDISDSALVAVMNCDTQQILAELQ